MLWGRLGKNESRMQTGASWCPMAGGRRFLVRPAPPSLMKIYIRSARHPLISYVLLLSYHQLILTLTDGGANLEQVEVLVTSRD